MQSITDFIGGGYKEMLGKVEETKKVDENEEVEREKDEEYSEAMVQAENNFINSL